MLICGYWLHTLLLRKWEDFRFLSDGDVRMLMMKRHVLLMADCLMLLKGLNILEMFLVEWDSLIERWFY
jgi:hypothetical protein